jgi:hypothetical protein
MTSIDESGPIWTAPRLTALSLFVLGIALVGVAGTGIAGHEYSGPVAMTGVGSMVLAIPFAVGAALTDRS